MPVRPLPILIVSAALSTSLIFTGCNKKDETANQENTTGGTVAQAPSDTGTTAGSGATATTTAGGGETRTTAGTMNTGATATASNMGVTAKIKNAINLSKVINHAKSKINVDTTDTEVVLRGAITSEKERQEAVKLAKVNAGTRKVVDQLTGGAKP